MPISPCTNGSVPSCGHGWIWGEFWAVSDCKRLLWVGRLPELVFGFDAAVPFIASYAVEFSAIWFIMEVPWRRACGIEDFKKRSIYCEFYLSKLGACETWEPSGEKSKAGCPWNDYATKLGVWPPMSLSDMRTLSIFLAPLRSAECILFYTEHILSPAAPQLLSIRVLARPGDSYCRVTVS